MAYRIIVFILWTITANAKTSNIRANFENLAKDKEQEDRRKAEIERAQRMAKDKEEQEEARRTLEVGEIHTFVFLSHNPFCFSRLLVTLVAPLQV